MLLALFLSAPALAKLPRPIAPKLLVCLYHFYALKLSTPQNVLFGHLNPVLGNYLRRNLLLADFPWPEISKLERKHGYFLNKQKNQTFIFPKIEVL